MDIEPDWCHCPECGARHQDLDGFGFIYCDLCSHCMHPSADGDDEGYFHCTVCGDCLSAPDKTTDAKTHLESLSAMPKNFWEAG